MGSLPPAGNEGLFECTRTHVLPLGTRVPGWYSGSDYPWIGVPNTFYKVIHFMLLLPCHKMCRDPRLLQVSCRSGYGEDHDSKVVFRKYCSFRVPKVE